MKHSLRYLPVAAILLAAALGACTTDGDPVTASAGKSIGKASGGTNFGGSISTGGATPQPATASVSPSPSPSATVSASPTVAPTTYVPQAIDLSVSPATATIGVQPAAGATPYMSTSVQLAASVLLSNGARVSQANWSTSNAAMATVNSTGLVTSGSTGGTVTVTAVSTDGHASASAVITVGTDGGAAVTIQ